MPTLTSDGLAAGTSLVGAFQPVPPADPLATFLPQLVIPSNCGDFRRDGHGIEEQPMFGDAPMQTGAARRRRIYLATPRVVTASLEVTQSALAEFVAWFEGPLAVGSNFFAAKVANQGPGTLWWRARILGVAGQSPYTTNYLGGIWWEISLKLVLFGDGSTTGPVSNPVLAGGATFALTGAAALTALQPLSGGAIFDLLPVSAAAGGVLSGGALFALLVGTYFPPAPVGSAAGHSTANAIPTDGFVGNSSGSSVASGVAINPAVGNASGVGSAIAAAVTQGLTYPDEKGTWVNSTGAITVGINDIAIYFLRPRTLVGVSIVTIGGVGSCQLDIYKQPIGSYPPSAANSICAAAKPVISSGRTYVDTTLTGWTKSFAAGDIAVLHVDSSTIFTAIFLKLHFRET